MIALLYLGIRLYNGKNGYYILFPSRKNKDGKKYQVIFPCNNELREMILEEIKSKYISESK